jgi:hypothetical protein
VSLCLHLLWSTTIRDLRLYMYMSYTCLHIRICLLFAFIPREAWPRKSSLFTRRLLESLALSFPLSGPLLRAFEAVPAGPTEDRNSIQPSPLKVQPRSKVEYCILQFVFPKSWQCCVSVVLNKALCGKVSIKGPLRTGVPLYAASLAFLISRYAARPLVESRLANNDR